jgi:acyl-coenzyme A synthetase/AMP-(fatty) acid ligase
MIRMVVPPTDIPFAGRKRPTYSPILLERCPLLAHTSLEDCIARRNGDRFTVRQFLASVRDLVSRLPDKRHAINLCKDRYHFLVAFAAALLSRHVSLLPTCRAPEVLAELINMYPETYILADHQDVPADIPLCRVPDGVLSFSRTDEIPTIPSTQIAAIVFTSGSSGLPRAHAKTWGSLVRGAQALKRQFGIGEECSPIPIVVGTVPAQHMYGLETTIMLPLQCGWGIHAGHPILPSDIREALEKMGQPTWLMTIPLHLRAFVGQRITLPGLTEIISATMPLARSLASEAEDLWNVPVREMYGCTEGGVIGSRRTTTSHAWTICPGLRLWQEGDAAWVSGGHVGQSLRLADRITVQSPTEFMLHGPSHDLVKVAGKRMSLAALNAALAQIVGVVDGTFYRPHRSRSATARLTAFVVAPGIKASTILTELRKRIDPLFLPRPLHLVEALPRNLTGKLPRERLDEFAAKIALRHKRRRG